MSFFVFEAAKVTVVEFKVTHTIGDTYSLNVFVIPAVPVLSIRKDADQSYAYKNNDEQRYYFHDFVL